MLTPTPKPAPRRGRMGRALIVVGGVLAGPPLAVPALDAAVCYVRGGTECADVGLAVILLAVAFVVAVVGLIALMVRGGRAWLVLGGLAGLAVAANSGIDLIGDPDREAILLLADGFIVAGGLALITGAVLRYLAGADR